MRSIIQISAFLLGGLLLFSLGSCHKPGMEYPTTPQIKFENYKIQKSVFSDSVHYELVLNLSFTDGDGDIGLSDSDTTDQYKYNILVEYFEKIDGKFRHINVSYPRRPFPSDDTISYNGRLPDLRSGKKPKAIQGNIEYHIDMGSGIAGLYHGTRSGNPAKFAITIFDHALHESNKVETPEITFD